MLFPATGKTKVGGAAVERLSEIAGHVWCFRGGAFEQVLLIDSVMNPT